MNEGPLVELLGSIYVTRQEAIDWLNYELDQQHYNGEDLARAACLIGLSVGMRLPIRAQWQESEDRYAVSEERK